jgi:hypothetical protein
MSTANGKASEREGRGWLSPEVRCQKTEGGLEDGGWQKKDAVEGRRSRVESRRDLIAMNGN